MTEVTESFWEMLDRRRREAEACRPAVQADADTSALLTLARSGGLLGANKPQTRAIGERANARGGLTEMQRVAMLLRSGYPHGEGGEDGWHPGELECAWDKIGLWRW